MSITSRRGHRYVCDARTRPLGQGQPWRGGGATMAPPGLTIGQAAKAAGVTRKAVRVYEARGLLPAPDRSTAGYRLYDPHDVELLAFIRRARTLGLHLDDIRDVLAIRDGGTPPSASCSTSASPRSTPPSPSCLPCGRRSLRPGSEPTTAPMTSPSPSAGSSKTHSTPLQDHPIAPLTRIWVTN